MSSTKKIIWLISGLAVYLLMIAIFSPPNFHSAILLSMGKLNASAFAAYTFRSMNFASSDVVVFYQKISFLMYVIIGFIEVVTLARSKIEPRAWLIWFMSLIVRTPLNIGIQIFISGFVLSWLLARKTRPLGIIIFFIACANGIMVLNPGGIIQRARVMKNYENFGLVGTTASTINLQLDADCTWVTEVRDLYARNLLEEVRLKNLWNAKKIILLDLKLVEANLPLLKIKNKSNEYVFGEAALIYSEAEKKYAQATKVELETTEHVCLLSHFSIHPEEEIRPFSRGREIVDERKKQGKRITIYNF